MRLDKAIVSMFGELWFPAKNTNRAQNACSCAAENGRVELRGSWLLMAR